MKYILVLNFFIIFSLNSVSQNLVRNWSFEDTTSCPTMSAQIDKAEFWFTPRGGGGSSELFSYCNNFVFPAPGFVGTPVNGVGYQIPRLGVNYAGITCYVNSETREYIETKLTRVLDPTVNYYVEFWVSLSNESNYAIENIGAYFSTDTLHYSSNLTSLIDAQVENHTGIISDTLNWVKVSGYFKPDKDGYLFLTIGNFNVSDSTNKLLVGWHSYDGAYYYIENVVVIDSALQHTIGIESPRVKGKSLKYKVFPNPASSKIQVEFDLDINQDIEIQTYNILGEHVLNEKKFCQKSITLDVSGLESGIYFIRVIDENGRVYSEKLIKE